MGRVRFGVKNVFYAKVTSVDSGKYTYATPKPLPGAKHLTLEPQGENTDEYADDAKWFSDTTNNGYNITLESEDTPESEEFEREVLGQTKNEQTGAVTEKSTDQQAEFALMWQFSYAGDDSKTPINGKRGVLYRCKVSRPQVEGQTNEAGKTIATNSYEGSALARLSDDKVKSSAVSTDAAYNTWFDKVYEDPEPAE